MVDERGLEALTTRALGQRLAVDPTAVYRHFRSKHELINALADRIVGAGTQPPVSSDGDDSPRDQLRSACLALRQALPADDYPNTTAVALRLYGSLEEQFAYGLERLLDGLDLARGSGAHDLRSAR